MRRIGGDRHHVGAELRPSSGSNRHLDAVLGFLGRLCAGDVARVPDACRDRVGEVMMYCEEWNFLM